LKNASGKSRSPRTKVQPSIDAACTPDRDTRCCVRARHRGPLLASSARRVRLLQESRRRQ
jgi:hypothetical protein